jgi:hydroxypyruvate isomerase
MPFLDRLSAAKAAGFQAVECWFPYEHGVANVARSMRELGLEMVGINTCPGGPSEWGLAALPGREAEFLESVDQALDASQQLGRCSVHVMGGLVGHLAIEDAWRTYIENLTNAVRRAERAGIQLLIEPLNSRDRPGYVLSSVDRAAEVVDYPGLSAVKIMFDCYHVQVEQGDLIRRLRAHWRKVGHIQVASPPDRSEPGTGEIDYAYVFEQIDRLGWAGWIGAEYKPTTETTSASLGWLQGIGGGHLAVSCKAP